MADEFKFDLQRVADGGTEGDKGEKDNPNAPEIYQFDSVSYLDHYISESIGAFFGNGLASPDGRYLAVRKALGRPLRYRMQAMNDERPTMNE